MPDYETLMRPTLAALATGQPQTRSQVRDAVGAAVGIGEDELAEMLPSGKATIFGSRVGWALTYMAQAGLAARPKRGVYVITDRGRTVLGAHPKRVDNKVLEQFSEFLEFRARRNEKGEPVGSHGEPRADVVSTLSPTEAIERLISDADDAVAAELLDRVLAQSPVFLEMLGLRLLRAMGYGGREALLSHTGKPGDGGLDGIVRQDALGLDLVGVQAKRYDRDGGRAAARDASVRRSAAGRADKPWRVRHDRTFQQWGTSVRRASGHAPGAPRRDGADGPYGAPIAAAGLADPYLGMVDADHQSPDRSGGEGGAGAPELIQTGSRKLYPK